MSISTDIVATYRGPGQVMRRLLAAGQREDRALAILMGACALIFVAQWPRLAREAHLTPDVGLDQLIGGSLLAWVFIMPLVLYGLAAISHVMAKALGGKGSWYGARLALFWSLLASSPLLMLYGLVAGFIGQGLELSIVGLIWLVAFGVFWLRTLRVAELEAAPQAD